jgi:allantoin racemase
MLTLMREAEKDGCGAGIIGCFYDGGIRELRNSLRMPVVGMEEATVLLAATLGHRFSIIVGRRKWIPKMHDNVIRYGVESRLASFRSVEMGIPEIYANPTEFDSRVIEASLKATSEDGADVIILSELVPSSLEARAKDELPVALVDPGAVCWKWAEMAADLYLKLGLTHSHP